MEPYAYVDRFYTVGYQDIMAKVPKRHPKTCAWLFDETSVKQWLDGTGPNVFWLRGYPGLGKSVFAKYLVETLAEQGAIASPGGGPPTLAYFFCSYRDARAQSALNLVSTLIY